MTKHDAKYMKIIEKLTKESGCIRDDRQIAAIAVKDGKILGRAVNGGVRGVEGIDCKRLRFCIRKELDIPKGEKLEIEYCLHAEQRLITDAMRNGVSLVGATVYVTQSPCSICLRLLVECGVERIVYGKEYADAFSLQMVKILPVVLERFK